MTMRCYDLVQKLMSI